jgi:hypothetical protein
LGAFHRQYLQPKMCFENVEQNEFLSALQSVTCVSWRSCVQ